MSPETSSVVHKIDVCALFDDGSVARIVAPTFARSADTGPVLDTKCDDPLLRWSADRGFYAALSHYQLLGGPPYPSHLILWEFAGDGRQLHNYQGASAGLAFFIRFLILFCHAGRRPAASFTVAATGELSEMTAAAVINPVESLSSKLSAALTILKRGDKIFYPVANKGVTTAHRQTAMRKGIELMPISTTAGMAAIVASWFVDTLQSSIPEPGEEPSPDSDSPESLVTGPPVPKPESPEHLAVEPPAPESIESNPAAAELASPGTVAPEPVSPEPAVPEAESATPESFNGTSYDPPSPQQGTTLSVTDPLGGQTPPWHKKFTGLLRRRRILMLVTAVVAFAALAWIFSFSRPDSRELIELIERGEFESVSLRRLHRAQDPAMRRLSQQTRMPIDLVSSFFYLKEHKPIYQDGAALTRLQNVTLEGKTGYRFEVEADLPCYFYLFQFEGQSAVELLFPASSFDLENHLLASRQLLMIPGGNQYLRFRKPDTRQLVTLFFLATRWRALDIEKLCQQYDQAVSAADRRHFRDRLLERILHRKEALTSGWQGIFFQQGFFWRQ